jgi:hypothetical protein
LKGFEVSPLSFLLLTPYGVAFSFELSACSNGIKDLNGPNVLNDPNGIRKVNKVSNVPSVFHI